MFSSGPGETKCKGHLESIYKLYIYIYIYKVLQITHIEYDISEVMQGRFCYAVQINVFWAPKAFVQGVS